MNRQEQDARRMLRLAALLTLVTVIVFILDKMTGCSTQVKERIVSQPAPPVEEPPIEEPAPPLATCEDGTPLGGTLEQACPSGQTGKIVMVCTADGFREAARTCVQVPAPPGPQPCGPTATTFAAVQPILSRSCNGCHNGYDKYPKAKADAADYLRRFKLGINEPGHMPKGSQLTGQEISLFSDWISDGLCESPDEPGGNGFGFQSFRDTEQALLRDVTDTERVDVEDRNTTRYALAVDVINAGLSRARLDLYKAAVQKAVNSLSTERDMAPVEEIAPGIYRFDIDDIGMSTVEWRRLEDADLVNIESQTSEGQLLKLLTNTRKPWLHIASLIDAGMRNSRVYYDLLETPATFQEFTAALGVDYAEDLQRRDVVLSAFVGSPLSPHNRMGSVHKSRDGSLWCTYDTGPLDTAEKNFFEFPLLGDIGGIRNAQFIAGECIYTLPNGLHGYALFNAIDTFRNEPVLDGRGKPTGRTRRVFVRSDLDVLQEVAPVNVVRDFISPVSAEIRSGISCFRCHAPGILPMRDQIRSNTIANGAQFGTDKDLILDVYKVQPEMDQQTKRENDRYAAALRVFGITTTDPEEAITATSDSHQLPWNLAKVCGTLWLRSDDCTVLLNQSATAQAQWGQLQSGGSITFEQFFTSLPNVINDLRLFQDPL